MNNKVKVTVMNNKPTRQTKVYYFDTVTCEELRRDFDFIESALSGLARAKDSAKLQPYPVTLSIKGYTHEEHYYYLCEMRGAGLVGMIEHVKSDKTTPIIHHTEITPRGEIFLKHGTTGILFDLAMDIAARTEMDSNEIELRDFLHLLFECFEKELEEMNVRQLQ